MVTSAGEEAFVLERNGDDGTGDSGMAEDGEVTAAKCAEAAAIELETEALDEDAPASQEQQQQQGAEENAAASASSDDPLNRTRQSGRLAQAANDAQAAADSADPELQLALAMSESLQEGQDEENEEENEAEEPVQPAATVDASEARPSPQQTPRAVAEHSVRAPSTRSKRAAPAAADTRAVRRQ